MYIQSYYRWPQNRWQEFVRCYRINIWFTYICFSISMYKYNNLNEKNIRLPWSSWPLWTSSASPRLRVAPATQIYRKATVAVGGATAEAADAGLSSPLITVRLIDVALNPLKRDKWYRPIVILPCYK